MNKSQMLGKDFVAHRRYPYLTLILIYLLCCGHSLSATPIIISVNTEWDSAQIIDEDIIVLPAVTLTIRSTVSMAANRRINIRRGGELRVEGGTITSQDVGLGERWNGIYVEGDPDEPQSNEEVTGRVYIRDGEILNSRNGISTSRNGDANYAGGIIECYDSVFKNNGRSLEFLEYKGEEENQSVVDFCHFKMTEEYLSFNGGFIAHITAFKVNNVAVEQSHFSIDEGIRNHRIFAGSSGVIVVQGRVYFQGNRFSNFTTGIDVDNTNVPSSFAGRVAFEGNEFTGNVTGIEAKSVLLDCVGNMFKLGGTETSPVGMIMDECSGYFFTQNVFEKDPQFESTKMTGLEVKNSGPEENTITINCFTDLKIGIHAIGGNRHENNIVGTGLKFLCNRFENNDRAIEVSPVDTLDLPDGTGNGIREFQSSELGGRPSAGNCFINNNVDIENNAEPIQYQYTTAAGFDYQEPLNVIGEVFVFGLRALPNCGLEEDAVTTKPPMPCDPVEEKIKSSTNKSHFYPNPSRDIVQIDLGPNWGKSRSSQLRIAAVDNWGRPQILAATVDGTRLSLDISHLPAGSYQIQLITAEQADWLGTIIKQ